MTDTDLAFASIEQVARLYRQRKLSPVELTKLMLARIEQLNPRLNAYITVTAELALAQAKKAEAELFAPRGRKGHHDRGPLHGIPISLKDNIYTSGIRTTAGSKILKDSIPKDDAAVVTQLKEAGAVILGKTKLRQCVVERATRRDEERRDMQASTALRRILLRHNYPPARSRSADYLC